MTKPLLFDKRQALAPEGAAEYVGTDTEMDPKDALGSKIAAEYVGTETEMDLKG